MDLEERIALAEAYTYDSLMSQVGDYPLGLRFARDGERFLFYALTGHDRSYYAVDPATGEKTPVDETEYAAHAAAPDTVSPDGRYELFVMEYDLYLRELSSGRVHRLSHDGEEHRPYALECGACGAQATRKIRGEASPVCAVWSPDAKRVLTHVIDERNVREQFLMYQDARDGAPPRAYPYRLALPGDDAVPVCRYVVYDVETMTGREIDVDCSATFTGSPLADPVRALWSRDGRRVYFANQDRAYHRLTLYAYDCGQGSLETVVRIGSDRYTETAVNCLVPMTLTAMDVGDGRLLCCLDRDAYCHVYLYSPQKEGGYAELRLTRGSFHVRELLCIANGWLYFTASGFEADGAWPYYRQLGRVTLDGACLEMLTCDDCDHSFTLSLALPSRSGLQNRLRPAVSASGRYLLMVASSKRLAPVLSVYDLETGVTREICRARAGDVFSRPGVTPERFCIPADGNGPSLYGLICVPPFADAGRKCPVVEIVYNNQSASKLCDEKGFAYSVHMPPVMPMLAALGFVAVMTDTPGTSGRSKDYKHATYANIIDSGIGQSIRAIRELAGQRPYMDIDRVGVMGSSMGGLNALSALLRHGRFYKSGAVMASSVDESCLGNEYPEMILGAYDREVYQRNSVLTYADGLKAPLLMCIPGMDETVAVSPQYRLLDMFLENGADAEAVYVPHVGHEGISSYYVITKQLMHFVKTLMHELPPPAVRFGRGLRFVGDSLDMGLRE